MYKPCPPHQYRRKSDNRCVNKSDFKRERPKKHEERKRPSYKEESRWKEKKAKDKRECVQRSKLKLRPHQEKIVKYMRTHDGLLVVHGTGTGKTLTAVTISQCYLDDYPKRKVVFVGPASLLTNFRKELRKYGVSPIDIITKYKFYSFDKFLNVTKGRSLNNIGKRTKINWPLNPIPLNNKLLIVDEAHNMRNPRSSKSRALVKASFSADKRILLTATPFVNNMMDFVPLINMVYGAYVVGTKGEFNSEAVPDYLSPKTTEESLDSLGYLLRDKVDVVNTRDPKNFPTREDVVVKVPMTNAYYHRFVKLMNAEHFPLPRKGESFGFSEPSTFYNGYRRACQKSGTGVLEY